MKVKGSDLRKTVERIYETPVERGLTRYEIWEQRRAAGDSITPSTFSEDYCRKVAEKIVALAGIGSSVLSIGCGNGFLEKSLKAFYLNVLATDISEQALGLAQKKELETQILNAMEIPWNIEDNRFHVVLAEGVIGHLIKDQSIDYFVNEAHRVTKPGGKLIIINDESTIKGVDIQRHKDPSIDFCWVSQNFVGRSITRKYSSVETSLIQYQKPISGTKNRVFSYGTK